MGLADILEMDFTGKSVLIIGCPASGKTWLCNQLVKPTHKIIHTDSYKSEGYQMGMYAALNAVTCSDKPTIVEGVHGYRMLRKGAEYGNYYPDIVIEMKVSKQRMMQTYIQERDRNKIQYLQQFNQTHEKILNDYKDICPPHLKPQWITLENNY